MAVWLVLAGLNGAIGVAMSAVAAHAFGTDAAAAGWTQTAAHTQTLHAAALLGVALLAERRRSWAIPAAGALFTAGIALFAGSLYLRAFGVIASSPLAPMGGSLLIIGWLAVTAAGVAPRGRQKG